MTEPTEQERRFETLTREIAVAVREQGDDPKDNHWLTDAMRRARSINMPADMIERARGVGNGTIDGPTWEESTLEGYGPNGVAVYVRLLTDNPRSSAHEIEDLFEQHGGNLGDDGCVAWQFQRRGIVDVAADAIDDADAFMLEVIEHGAEEMEEPVGGDDFYRVYTDPDDVGEVASALAESGYELKATKVDFESTQHVPLDSSAARKFLGFFEELQLREDVLGAYSNWRMA